MVILVTLIMYCYFQSFEENVMYTLIGLVCGLAIYNSTIVDLQFPLALYKKLLNKYVLLVLPSIDTCITMFIAQYINCFK